MNRSDYKTLVNELQDAGYLPLIQIHLLRPIGPSCLNRDFGQQQKTIVIGGKRRIRISSQAIKRPIRAQHEFGYDHTTRAIAALLQDYAKEHEPGITDEKLEAIKKVAISVFGKFDEKKGEVEDPKQLIVLCESDVKDIYQTIDQIISEGIPESVPEIRALFTKKIPDAAKRETAENISLFGRMSTAPDKKILDDMYSAVSINHAYGVEEFVGDVDDFTSADTYISAINDETGAGHLNCNDINAGTIYQYANISLRILFENMYKDPDSDFIAAVKTAFESKNTDELRKLLSGVTSRAAYFVREFVYTLPSGKQTTMATRPFPSALYINIGARPYPHSFDEVYNSVCREEGEAMQRFASAIEAEFNGPFAINDYIRAYETVGPYVCNSPAVGMDTRRILEEVERGVWIR